MTDVQPTIDFDFCIPADFSVADRTTLKSQIFAYLDTIDPGHTKRDEWADLDEVSALINGHIEDNVVHDRVYTAARTLLPAGDITAIAPMSKLCYKVVNNTITCYHCYSLYERGVKKTVNGNEELIALDLCYSWPFPVSI